MTQNLNECEKKSEYTETNLNLTTKHFYIDISTNWSQKKNLNFESCYLNFTKFQEKNLNDPASTIHLKLGTDQVKVALNDEI